MGIGEKIDKIKEAEKSYEREIEKSRIKAEGLIKETQMKEQQRLQLEISSAHKEAEEFLLKAEKETQEKINQIEIQVSKKIKEMQSELEKKREQATRMIQDRIVGLNVS